MASAPFGGITITREASRLAGAPGPRSGRAGGSAVGDVAAGEARCVDSGPSRLPATASSGLGTFVTLLDKAELGPERPPAIHAFREGRGLPHAPVGPKLQPLLEDHSASKERRS